MAYGLLENLADDYTLAGADQGDHFTVDGTKITWADLSRSDTAYLYKSFGLDYFTGDWTSPIRFKTVFSSSAVTNYGTCCLMLSTTIGELFTQITDDADIMYFKHEKTSAGPIFTNANYSAGEETDHDPSSVVSLGTVYYVTISKSTNTITTRIHTVDFYGEAGSVEFDTLTATIVGTDSFQYLYAACSYDTTNTGEISGYYEDIDIGENITPIFMHHYKQMAG